MLEVAGLLFIVSSLLLIATPGQDARLRSACARGRGCCSGFAGRAARFASIPASSSPSSAGREAPRGD
ncbi:MAG: hypothetical protein ACXU61_12315 [Croceibacterium sp.]